MTIEKESRSDLHQATQNIASKADFTSPSHALESPKQRLPAAAGWLTPTGLSSKQFDAVRRALSFISSEDRDVWVKVGMAIKSEFGDAGFDLWFFWSRQAASFRESDARAVWKSINETGGITIATLFQQAQRNGWRGRPEVNGMSKPVSATKPLFTPTRDRQNPRAVGNATAARAAAILGAADEAQPANPYLVRKGLTKTSNLKEIEATIATTILGYTPHADGHALTGRLLVVPIRREQTVCTVELIDGEKRKTALAGRGTKVGGYWSTDPLPDTDTDGLVIQIGEGVATALTANVATGQIGVATFSCSNLIHVAKTLRARYPRADIILLADLIKGLSEPVPQAVEAAVAVRGKLAIPRFLPNLHHNATDFNDLSLLCGLDAVRTQISAAESPAPVESDREDQEKGLSPCSVSLLCASEVNPEPISWLWPNWLAAGKLHILAGAPGTGKTTLAMEFSATITAGRTWPDGCESNAGNVVVWSGEDDPADTLIPRLWASKAEMSKVFFISGINVDGEKQPFDPAKDMDLLKRKLLEIGGVALLIIDPIVSVIVGDSHKNAEVRRGLQPLADLASEVGCAILGITHFSKSTGGRDPIERLTGSLAFGAVARVVLVAAKQQRQGDGDEPARLLCRAKSNIGPDDGGFEYELLQSALVGHPDVSASSIVWGNHIQGSAKELLTAAEASDAPTGSISEAEKLLRDMLSDGSVSAKELIEEGVDAGFSKRTIQRAAHNLGIVRRKNGMKGGWTWELPKMPNCLEDA